MTVNLGMAYVSDNPNFTAKSENSVSRKGDINGEPPDNITTDIKNHLLMLQQKDSLSNVKSNNQIILMDPIKTIEIDKFHDLVVDSPRLLQQFNIDEK